MDFPSINSPKGLTFNLEVPHLQNLPTKWGLLFIFPFIIISCSFITFCRKRSTENRSTIEVVKMEDKQSLEDILEKYEKGVSILELEKTYPELLFQEVPTCGLKDIFFETPPKGACLLSTYPAAHRLCLRDLLVEVQSKSHQLEEREHELAKWMEDIKAAKDEINLLQNQLDAEEQLRIQAESKSSLMQKELEKLHHIESKHNIEKEVLLYQLKQTQSEIELLKASRTGSDESTSKIEKMVAELKAEEAQTREEVLHLRATNKALLQKTAHDRQEHNRLLRQRNELKERIAALKPRGDLNYERLEDCDSLGGDDEANVEDNL